MSALRDDGTHAIYEIQHQHKGEDKWHTSNVDVFLFEGLTHDEALRGVGDRYRKLVKPTHDCWQQTSMRGFLDYEDAAAMLPELRASVRRQPTSRRSVTFRIAAVAVAQVTVPLDA